MTVACRIPEESTSLEMMERQYLNLASCRKLDGLRTIDRTKAAHSVSDTLLLNFNLAAFRNHDLRPTPIASYLSCHPHPQISVLVFRRPKLFAIRAPNQNSRIASFFALSDKSRLRRF
jgi:hypothetical protein